MKRFILALILLGITQSSIAQDPELVGDWKLADLVIDGVSYPPPLVDPSISVDPTLTYRVSPEEAIDTYIQGDDDLLSSRVAVDPITNEITVDEGWVILLGLGVPRYPGYREIYFDFIQQLDLPLPYTLSYEIIDQTGGVRTLVITDDDGNYAKYSNAPIPFHLFDDWELEKLVISGVEHPVPVNGEEFNPSFFFAETNDPDIATFTGDSGCNDFDGMITFDTANSELTITSRNISGNTCVEPQNIDYELLYTEFLFNGLPATFSHSTSVDFGLLLELTKSNGDKAFFRRDYYLSTPDNAERKFSIYPNPTNDVLNIASEGVSIQSVSVYSLNGRLLLAENNFAGSLNVSGFSSGIYLLRIETDSGSAVRKFIKN